MTPALRPPPPTPARTLVPALVLVGTGLLRPTTDLLVGPHPTPPHLQAFFDATGSLWQSGALVGKPAGCFTSTATQVRGLAGT